MINMSHILATALLLLVWCDVPSSARIVKRDQSIPDQERFNFFDLELLQSVTSANPTGNVLISPVSVKATLAMILEAAGGKSAEQIRHALRLPENQSAIQTVLHTYLKSLLTPHPGYKVALSNRVFLSQALYPNLQYAAALQRYYYADVEKVDFSAAEATAEQINRWVREITHGLIPQLVEPANIQPSAQVIVANAVYFKGKWQTQFDTQGTTPRCFYSKPSRCQNANMMETLGEYGYGYVQRLDAFALELPYQGNKFSMVIVMPNAKDGITQLVRDILHVPLYDIVNTLQTSDVLVSIPRFNIEFSTDLVSNLYAMGIRDIFGTNSNLTGLFSGVDTSGQVSNVFHKTKIIVNEEGSEAAAATGAQVIPLMGSTIPKFRADRPFLFFIRDVTTGVVLFSGRVTDPEFTRQEESIPEKEIESIFSSPRPQVPQSTTRRNRPNNRRTTTVRTTTQGREPLIKPFLGQDAPNKPIYNNVQNPSYAQVASNPQSFNPQNSQNSNSQYPQQSQGSNSQQSQSTNTKPSQQYSPPSQSSSFQQNSNQPFPLSNQSPPRPVSNTNEGMIHYPTEGTPSTSFAGTQNNQNAGSQYSNTQNSQIAAAASLPDTPHTYLSSRIGSPVSNHFTQQSNVVDLTKRKDGDQSNNQNTRRFNADTRTTQLPYVYPTPATALNEPQRINPYTINGQFYSNQPFQASGVSVRQYSSVSGNQQHEPSSGAVQNYQQTQQRAGSNGYYP